jgi:hypothetical protein
MLRKALVAALWLAVAGSVEATNARGGFSPTTTARRTAGPWAAKFPPRGGAAKAAAPAAGKKKAGPANGNKKGASNGASLSLPFTKADVVRAHGYAGLAFVAAWALESFGGPAVPLLGFGGTVKGINLDDPVTKFLVRTVCSLGLGVILAEICDSGNASLQKNFPLYQVPFFLSALVGAQEFAKGPLGYSLSAVLGMFLVLWLVA